MSWRYWPLSLQSWSNHFLTVIHKRLFSHTAGSPSQGIKPFTVKGLEICSKRTHSTAPFAPKLKLKVHSLNLIKNNVGLQENFKIDQCILKVEKNESWKNNFPVVTVYFVIQMCFQRLTGHVAAFVGPHASWVQSRSWCCPTRNGQIFCAHLQTGGSRGIV